MGAHAAGGTHLEARVGGRGGGGGEMTRGLEGGPTWVWVPPSLNCGWQSFNPSRKKEKEKAKKRCNRGGKGSERVQLLCLCGVTFARGFGCVMW